MSADTNRGQVSHTPGPWRAAPHGVIVGGPKDEYVGLIAGQSNWKANADLVAAAPELLEALVGLEEFSAYELEPHESMPDVGAVVDIRRLLAAARAAIAKAKGETA